MNTKQKVTGILALLLFLFAGIIPPWMAMADGKLFSLGYDWIFTSQVGVVDLTRLVIEWIMILITAGSLIYLFKS
jgi:hypothetical protein